MAGIVYGGDIQSIGTDHWSPPFRGGGHQKLHTATLVWALAVR
jgi:hypothetical protein